MTRSLVEDILKRSDAVMVLEQVQSALEDEARRRHEFREWLTPTVKAEFIQGDVVMHSPAKHLHLQVSGNIYTLFKVFVELHKLGATSVEKALVALTRNDYEPDVCFWGNEKAALFTDETMVHPPPDLVVEVLSKSTQKNDRGIKFEDYALHGVREYWIVDPWRKRIEQYSLLVPTDKRYLLFGKHGLSGEVTSIVLPEFTIPVKAVFDSKENLLALQQLMKG